MYNGFGFFLNRKPVAPTDGLFLFLANEDCTVVSQHCDFNAKY